MKADRNLKAAFPCWYEEDGTVILGIFPKCSLFIMFLIDTLHCVYCRKISRAAERAVTEDRWEGGDAWGGVGGVTKELKINGKWIRGSKR